MPSRLANGVQLSARGTLILDGSGAPEGVVTAPPGSKYHRTDGTEYRKTTGTGNTGWVELAAGGTILHTLLWNAGVTGTNKYEPNPPPAYGFYRYVGPTDPATLGVTLRTGDEWINTLTIEPPPRGVVALPADVVNSTLTLADITGLEFPVEANVRYWFKFFMAFGTAANTTGARVAMNGPTLANLTWRAQVTSGVGQWVIYSGGVYDGAGPISANSTPDDNNAVIEGVIRTTVAGNVIARFASEIGGSAVTMQAGRSFVEYMRLPSVA
ncbi:MAG TPA: hypothetical protein VNM48_16655 [Chloroflexota bacterium]|nr:hypothetical protein [Chloroflexota bacterium]